MSAASSLFAGAAPRGRAVPAAVTRRRLEMALGTVWLLDGALQFQPAMFSKAFFTNTLGMANMGLPGPVTAVLYRLTGLLARDPAFWTVAFGSLQLAIGAGLLWARTARLTRPVSVMWALAVWAAGEGVGGLFMPGVSALNGAPGAALLYAAVTVVLWPCRPDDGAAPTDAGPLGAAGAPWCWVALWTGLALLELQGANHAAVVPGAEVANIGEGEPGWLATLNHSAGHLLAGRGSVFALTVGLAQLVIGLGVLHPRARRAALGAGIILAAAYGLFGQDFGGILTGQATDPGTAPLLALLALALWPRRRLPPYNTSPAELGR